MRLPSAELDPVSTVCVTMGDAIASCPPSSSPPCPSPWPSCYLDRHLPPPSRFPPPPPLFRYPAIYSYTSHATRMYTHSHIPHRSIARSTAFSSPVASRSHSRTSAGFQGPMPSGGRRTPHTRLQAAEDPERERLPGPLGMAQQWWEDKLEETVESIETFMAPPSVELEVCVRCTRPLTWKRKGLVTTSTEMNMCSGEAESSNGAGMKLQEAP